MNVPNYPSNSHSSASNKPKLVPIANASQRGVSRQRQMANLIGESVKDAKEDIWNNQIVPGFLDMCANAMYTFIDYIFYRGERHGRSSRSELGDIRRRTDYAGASRSASKTGQDRYYDDSRSGRQYKWNEVVVQGTQQDAQRVWDALAERLEDQSEISVGDLFAAVGWPTCYNDFNMGWTTLDGCRITRIREGWWFDMTKPKRIS